MRYQVIRFPKDVELERFSTAGCSREDKIFTEERGEFCVMAVDLEKILNVRSIIPFRRFHRSI